MKQIISGFIIIASSLFALRSEKICKGTNYGLTHHRHSERWYNKTRLLLSNCSTVLGNLELTWLNNPAVNYDLGFLHTIREVTGYVLVSNVGVSRLPFDGLTVIRGRTLFRPQRSSAGYALYVTHGFMADDSQRPIAGRALQSLGLRSLHEIQNGGVYLHGNLGLCYDRTVNWQDEIVSDRAANVEIYNDLIDSDNETIWHASNCSQAACHPNCSKESNGEAYCWGPEPADCQTFTKSRCTANCDFHCFGTYRTDCCHNQCVGGCSGPKDSDCFACKMFSMEDHCVEECPRNSVYNFANFSSQTNPNARLTAGTFCVKKCPAFLVRDGEHCVGHCSPGWIEVDNKCEECPDNICPKECNGVTDNEWVTSENIEQFENCTIVRKNIILINDMFDISLLRYFRHIQVVRGFLKIELGVLNDPLANNFGNLRIISGQFLDMDGSSLHITHTNLKSLDFMSSLRVENGNILIVKNQFLCFGQGLVGKQLRTVSSQKVTISNNRNSSLCQSEGMVCSPECSDDGCWSSEPDKCISCRNFTINGLCVESCETSQLYLSHGNVCGKCHEECVGGCHTNGSDSCVGGCKSFRDGNNCVPSCPFNKFPDANEHCRKCHPACRNGCSGSSDIVGGGGCNSCHLAEWIPIETVNGSAREFRCLPPDSGCPLFHFQQRKSMKESHPLAGQGICEPCHSLCKTCRGPTEDDCIDCKHFRMGSWCVASCAKDTYADNETSKCERCDDQCRTCWGPGTKHCLTCRGVRVPLSDDRRRKRVATEESNDQDDGAEEKFECRSNCPEERKYANFVILEGRKVSLCMTQAEVTALSAEGTKKHKIMAATLVACFVSFAVFAAFLFICFRRKVRKERLKKVELQLTAGVEENEPLSPTENRPNMAHIRLIKESELKRRDIIGSGAFGTVYRGVWQPEEEKVSIPVAIKVLQEGSGALSKELLEEAHVMASVVHPCCVRVIAICLASQPMLITQLMPNGSLLEYVRKHRRSIGSQTILNWCAQIARGMAYLEQRAIVHRDLAARNVLVHSDNTVKITDFGLAKLLDFEEAEYRATGGKMPIKWLALECIQRRIFTSKSDVWSYGVTAWEICTFGERPYENVSARQVPDLLEKGERLPQPLICSIDVYMIMIKCWMLESASRPSFPELHEEFSKMARDPARFLAIDGDPLQRPAALITGEDSLLCGMAESPERMVMDAEQYLMPSSASTSRYCHEPGSSAAAESPYDEDDYLKPLNSRSEYLNRAVPAYIEIKSDDAVENPSYMSRRPNYITTVPTSASSEEYDDEGEMDRLRSNCTKSTFV